MANRKKPKTALGQPASLNERDLVSRISEKLSGSAESGVPESSPLENLAFDKGAALLFRHGKEGCISSLGIVLIPDENKQNRRVAAVADAFGFVAYLSHKQWIAVLTPKGYVTDFASIPSFGHWLISPFGKHAEAAVVHDWLYTLGKKGDGRGRKVADRTFRRALKLVGVGWLRRHIMYWAVRLGGGGGYGLDSDYDFRALPLLEKRNPLPQKPALMTTFDLQTFKGNKKAREEAQAKFIATLSAPGPQT